MSDPVLVCRGLGRRFGRRPLVLRDVDLVLFPGEILGLVGPNGGGKSTLMLLMAGLLTPSTGTVEQLDGVPAQRLARTAQGQVGLITAEPGLYPLLTVRENLRYFGSLYGLAAAEVDGRIEPLVEELQLSAFVDRAVAEGSSGMKQKTSLVRALLMEPRVLLLDEPTANLDPVSARAILGAVRRRADAGLAVVLCTHDLVAAECLCERVVLIAGRILDTTRFDAPRTLPPVGELFAPYQAALGGVPPGETP